MSVSYCLTLIRHGETKENRLGIIQGQMDCPLSAAGFHQARLLGRRLNTELAQNAFTHVFSSDLQRASQTAVTSLDQCTSWNRHASSVLSSTASEGSSTDGSSACPATTSTAERPGAETGTAASCSFSSYPRIRTDRLLREYRCGAREGKTHAEARRMSQQVDGPTSAADDDEGAESEQDMTARVREFFGKLNGFARDECAAQDAESEPASLPPIPGMGAGGAAATQKESAKPLHVAVYSHGGWIAAFMTVVQRDARFVLHARCRGPLAKVPRNTAVSRFNVRLDAFGGQPRVECVLAHDTAHLDA